MFFQASAVSYQGAGILITGQSGSGKSDLALRLIQDHGARLVADDGVLMQKKQKDGWHLFPHPETNGLLEVRGLGLVCFETEKDVPLVLHVALHSKPFIRLPSFKDLHEEIEGQLVFSVKINPFHVSSTHRVIAALDCAKTPQRLYQTSR